MKTVIIEISCLLILLLAKNIAFATSVSVSGNVSGTWNVDTVFVTGQLLIPENESLLIAPGTRIEFQQYYTLEIRGNVLAMGLPADTILFTIRDTTNFFSQSSGRGGWSGIRFADTPASSDSSLFSFCRFEFSKAAEDSSNCYGGAVFIKNFGKVRFSDCFFYHNYSYYSGGAIYLRYADALIEHCLFTSNYSGNTGNIYGYGGGICSLFSSPIVTNNAFYSNSSTGVGGAVSFDYSDPLFSNNRMMYNFSGLGGAFGVLRSSPARTMANNLVANNNCLFFGGGVCCIRSFPVFSNLTICCNSSAYGGGLYCNDSAAPKMYNSIIFGNSGFGTSVYIWDIYSAPNFYYCTIEGDSSGFEGSGGNEGYHGEYLDNMNLEPSFIEIGTEPYQLNIDSPCIDVGTPDPEFLALPVSDLVGSPRIVNRRIDLGAYEYNGTVVVPENSPSDKRFFKIYPNPFTDFISFQLIEPSAKNTVYEIIDLTGRVIQSFYLTPGTTGFTWDGTSVNGSVLPDGPYFLHSSTARSHSIPIIKLH